MDTHKEHKDFAPWDFCRVKIKAQIFQTTPETAWDSLCSTAKGQCNCSCVMHPSKAGWPFTPVPTKAQVGPGRIYTRDSSTCCTVPAGRVKAPSDILSCTLASLQGFITCLWAARGFFHSITPLRDQYPLCSCSLEEDEGWAGAEGTTQCSEQVTVTRDATASGWKMGFIWRHK